MYSSFRTLRNHVSRIRASNEDNVGVLTPRELLVIDAEFAPSIVGMSFNDMCWNDCTPGLTLLPAGFRSTDWYAAGGLLGALRVE